MFDLKGNFKDARFNMEENNFSRFDELVFGPIVRQQRVSPAKGFINVLKSIALLIII